MLKMRGCYGILLLALVLMVALATNVAAQTKPYTLPKQISLGASAQGGNMYVIGSAIATILKDKLKMDTSVEASGGSVHNVQLVQTKQSNIGITVTSSVHEGWFGTAKWTEGKKYQDIRSMIKLYPATLQVMVRANSNIKTLTDLTGKVVGLGRAGSTHDDIWREVFKALNIKPKNIVNAEFGDLMDQIRDRKMDGILMVSSYPNATFMDFSTTTEVAMVPISEQELDAMLKLQPFLAKDVIPANTYKKGQPQDYRTASLWAFLIAHKDEHEELVYALSKQIVENWSVLVTASKPLGTVKPTEIDSLNLPLHKGAIKYLKEIGMKIPDRLIPPEAK
jgi:uncharacterized protein